MFFSSACKSPAIQLHKPLDTKMGEGIVQPFRDVNIEALNVSIGNTNDNIKFKEDGKVYLQLSKDNQIFDITQIHQQRRLSGLKKFMQSAK